MKKCRAERYGDFFWHRFLPQCWGDIKASVAEQVVGVILALFILLAQIQLGIVSKDTIRANLLASVWPYLALIGVFVVYHVLRAPWLVSNSHLDTIVDLKTELGTSTDKLEAIEKAKPKIKLKEPGAIYVEPVRHNFNDGYEFDVPFLKMRFINDPPRPYPASKAPDVRAKIRYYRLPDNEHILSVDGRWSDTDQPSGLNPLLSKTYLLGVGFSQGEEHSLDIAYRDGETRQFFAWNNDNYRYHHFRFPHHLLRGKHFRVEVRLLGDWIDETFVFTFKTAHTERGFELDEAA